MTDLRLDDAAFEQQLRAVLADLAPDVAPGSLRRRWPPCPREPDAAAPPRAGLPCRAGLAAAVAGRVAAIGLVAGPRPRPARYRLARPGDVPTAVPSPRRDGELTFDVVTPDGSMATKQVLAVEDVMDARLHAYGVGLFSSSASDDRITYEIPIPQGTRRRSTRCARCSGRRARSRSRCWARTPWTSAPVTVPPLVTGDAVTDARTGGDQSRDATLDLTFDATGSAAVADATRTHVGEYLAIALDGVAITVPVIDERDP